MLRSLENEQTFNTAKRAYENREYSKASAMLQDLLDVEANNVQALFYMANIFHIKGQISKAIKAFKKVLELEPNHTDASISLSVLYNDIGHYEEAKAIFKTASKRVKVGSKDRVLDDKHINNKFSLKHYELAEQYFTYNRYDEALFEYNKAIKLNESNYEARVKVAKVYAKKGFLNKAHEELTRLKNESPRYLPGRIALGVLYYGKGDILKAQVEWEKVMALDPANAEAGMYLNLSKTATETNI